MNSIHLVSMMLHCLLCFYAVEVASVKSSSSRQSQRLGPRGTSSRMLDDTSSTSSTTTAQQQQQQDANFKNRQERFQMKRQLKCKDQFVDETVTPLDSYLFVDCTPSATQNFETDFPTQSPTVTPVPTMTAFPTTTSSSPDRKSTRLNSSHLDLSRMPSSA